MPEGQNIFLTQIVNEHVDIAFFVCCCKFLLSFLIFTLLTLLMTKYTISYCDITTCKNIFSLIFLSSYSEKKYYFHFEMMETLNINILIYTGVCLVRAIKKCCLFSKAGFQPGQRLFHLGDYSEHCVYVEMQLEFVPGAT